MKILLLSRYGPLGASSRVRSYQYLPYLQAHGVEVTVAPLLGDRYIQNLYAGKSKQWGSILLAYAQRLKHLLRCRQFDLLWVEKELLPWLPAWLETLLARLKVPYVVDYDDAVFHRYDRHSQPLVRTLRHKIDRVMQAAVMVIAGNDYLAQRAQVAGARRVEILPSAIDLARYPATAPASNEKFTIGWIGSPTTTHYLYEIAPALAKVCALRRAQVILVGAKEVQLAGVPLQRRPWSAATEVAELQQFDVGIMPLPNGDWERGKCGFKLIQYMGCACPVVGSPVGVNRQLIADGVNGFQASSLEEWVWALSTLQNNQALRQEMGINGRKKVEQNYAVQVTAPYLLALLRSCSLCP